MCVVFEMCVRVRVFVPVCVCVCVCVCEVFEMCVRGIPLNS